MDLNVNAYGNTDADIVKDKRLQQSVSANGEVDFII